MQNRIAQFTIRSQQNSLQIKKYIIQTHQQTSNKSLALTLYQTKGARMKTINRQISKKMNLNTASNQQELNNPQSSFSLNNKQNQNFQQQRINSQTSIESPIKRLKSSKYITNNINSENIIPGILKATAQKRKDLYESLHNQTKQQTYSTHHKDSSQQSDDIEKSFNQKQTKINQNEISKIELGNESVVEVPVQKVTSNDDLQFGEGLEEITELSEGYSVQSEKNDFKSLQSIPGPKQTKSILKKPKQAQQKVTSDVLLIPPKLNQQQFQAFPQKKPKKERKHSLQIADSIMSPLFQSYLAKSRHKRLPSPICLGKRSHHNQLPQIYHSDTYPRCQYPTFRKAIVKQDLQLCLANNLDKILFKYNGGHARILYNNKLKIKNNTSIKVQVKIMCTSPSHYEVRPVSSAILDPGEILNVLIEMKLYLHDLNHTTMKHDLSGYRKDMFKICYVPCEQCNSDVWYEQGEKVLPVVIEDTQEQRIRNQGLMKDMDDEEMRLAKGERNIQMYKRMIEKAEAHVRCIDGEIERIQKQRFYTEYLTTNLFLVVAIIGLLIGLWMG